MKQNYINHICFVLDRSGSMSHLKNDLIKVFDNQIEFLARRSKEVDQETRVSVYLFDDVVDNIIYDKDCLRVPSIKDEYVINGYTALVDATMKCIKDLEQTATLYGDHSFLIYVLSDGADNRSKTTAQKLREKIDSLPENWTLAAFCPDATAVSECKKFGFPANNISLWSTNALGMTEVGEVMKKTSENFFVARSNGTKGTKNLFTLDTSKLDKATIAASLKELSESIDYLCFPVREKQQIKPFVESCTKKNYVTGSAFYQFMKTEHIQANKQILVQNKLNGKVYGGLNARKILGLPTNAEVKVTPSDFGEYDIYVQSTSPNRNLIPGTNLIVMQ